MLRRPEGDSPAEQTKKQRAHIAANEAVKRFCASGEYFTAYVVAYALLEDRLVALDVLARRHSVVEPVTNRRALRELKAITERLFLASVIERELRDEVLNLADMRNKIVHSAIYNIHSVKRPHVERVMKAKKDLQNLVRRSQRKWALLAERQHF